jgi:hypothetical protein
MNLKYYKTKIKAIDREMKSVKQNTTPEIEQTIQRLRELRENWARYYLCPNLNRLEEDRQQLFRLIESERKRLDANKAAIPDRIQSWFQNYCRTHKGRFKIRALGSSKEWVILTKLSSHSRPTEHYALMVLDWDRQLFTRQGRLTETALGQMIHSMEAACKSPDGLRTVNVGLSDTVYPLAAGSASEGS